MEISQLAVFATVVNAGVLAWQLRPKRKAPCRLPEIALVYTEISLLKTTLCIEKAERHRVAQALHLKSSSTLAAVKMYLRAVHGTGGNSGPADPYDTVHTLLDSAYAEINKHLYSLLPELALETGFDDAVRKFCSHLTTHQLLQVEYDSWGTPRRYHEAFELAAFRLLQMLVNVILQQGSATLAVVQVGLRSESMTIAVEDNGTGYPPVAELAENPLWLHLEKGIGSLLGQLEVRTDNGLSVFVQLDTAPFHIADRTPVPKP